MILEPFPLGSDQQEQLNQLSQEIQAGCSSIETVNNSSSSSSSSTTSSSSSSPSLSLPTT